MSKSSVEQRAFKNTIVGAASFVVTLLQTLLLVPILLKYWGNTNYGLWLILMAGFNLLQTLDLGHQNFIGNRLNILYHSDLAEFRRTLGSSILVAYLLGGIEITICVLLAVTDHMHVFLSISQQEMAQQHLSLAILLLMTMWLTFGSAGGIVGRIMVPTGLYFEAQWLGIAIRLSQFLSIVFVAVLGGDILLACYCYAIVQSAMMLIVFRYIKLKLPQFYPWWRDGRWRTGLQGLKKSLVLAFNSIGQQLSNNGLIILISALFTSAVVPSFTTLRTVTNTAGAVTTILINSILPDMIRYHATGEAKKLISVLNANWFISGTCVNFGILIVIPVIDQIYRFWTKGHLEFNSSLFFLLTVAISLSNFGSGLTLYLVGINNLRAQTAITVARAITLLVLGYCLSSRFGILSFGISCVVAEVLASAILPVIFVNKELTRYSTRLTLNHLCLALSPPLILMIASVAIILRHIPFYVLSLLLLPLFGVIYYFNWKHLGTDVRKRIKTLATTLTRRLSLYP